MKHFFIRKQLNKEKKPFLYVKIANGQGGREFRIQPRQTNRTLINNLLIQLSTKIQETGSNLSVRGSPASF